MVIESSYNKLFFFLEVAWVKFPWLDDEPKALPESGRTLATTMQMENKTSFTIRPEPPKSA